MSPIPPSPRASRPSRPVGIPARSRAWLALASAGLVACTAARDTGRDSGTTPIEEGFVSIAAEPAERVPTVIRVRWETREPTTGTVVYELDGEPALSTRSDQDAPATAHEALLAGLPAFATVSFRIHAEDEAGTALESDPRMVETGALPASLPIPDLAVSEGGAEGGFRAFNLIGETEGIPAVVDDRGRFVWAIEPERASQLPRFLHGLDGASFLVGYPDDGPGWTGAVQRVGYDGTEQAWIDAPGLALDFVEYEPGRIAYIGDEVRTFEEGKRRIRGDAVLLVEPGSDPVTLWSVFDDFEPDLSETMPEGGPDSEGLLYEDWTHFNGIHYDSDHDAFLLTNASPDLQAVLRIGRASGALEWTLCDACGGDFVPQGVRLVEAPHSAQAVEGGILVFNRGDMNEACSRASEIALDEVERTARIVWTYEAEDCLVNRLFGQARRLPGGNTLVTWSMAGQVDEVTPEGDLVWRLRVPVGHALGYTERIERLGR